MWPVPIPGPLPRPEPGARLASRPLLVLPPSRGPSTVDTAPRAPDGTPLQAVTPPSDLQHSCGLPPNRSGGDGHLRGRGGGGGGEKGPRAVPLEPDHLPGSGVLDPVVLSAHGPELPGGLSLQGESQDSSLSADQSASSGEPRGPRDPSSVAPSAGLAEGTGVPLAFPRTPPQMPRSTALGQRRQPLVFASGPFLPQPLREGRAPAASPRPTPPSIGAGRPGRSGQNAEPPVPPRPQILPRSPSPPPGTRRLALVYSGATRPPGGGPQKPCEGRGRAQENPEVQGRNEERKGGGGPQPGRRRGRVDCRGLGLEECGHCLPLGDVASANPRAPPAPRAGGPACLPATPRPAAFPGAQHRGHGPKGSRRHPSPGRDPPSDLQHSCGLPPNRSGGDGHLRGRGGGGGGEKGPRAVPLEPDHLPGSGVLDPVVLSAHGPELPGGLSLQGESQDSSLSADQSASSGEPRGPRDPSSVAPSAGLGSTPRAPPPRLAQALPVHSKPTDLFLIPGHSLGGKPQGELRVRQQRALLAAPGPGHQEREAPSSPFRLFLSGTRNPSQSWSRETGVQSQASEAWPVCPRVSGSRATGQAEAAGTPVSAPPSPRGGRSRWTASTQRAGGAPKWGGSGVCTHRPAAVRPRSPPLLPAPPPRSSHFLGALSAQSPSDPNPLSPGPGIRARPGASHQLPNLCEATGRTGVTASSKKPVNPAVLSLVPWGGALSTHRAPWDAGGRGAMPVRDGGVQKAVRPPSPFPPSPLEPFNCSAGSPGHRARRNQTLRGAVPGGASGG
ncbi:basic proline-rich protein-like [Perognathus longimembris pacificus]|uniref:basic proline-rich protein-like n=1 Tax=Perognathus longimembris pacificus TaxID=214514 RepID=UPI00201A1A0B|nr:basic proline-rich protein-like [Perognathus longimembris pacificus]